MKKTNKTQKIRSKVQLMLRGHFNQENTKNRSTNIKGFLLQNPAGICGRTDFHFGYVYYCASLLSPKELSDPNLAPLPRHSDSKCVASSLCYDH